MERRYTYLACELIPYSTFGNLTLPKGWTTRPATPFDPTWEPIPELYQENADVSVIFMTSNNVLYRAPVLDPWFSANGSDTIVAADGESWIESDRWFGAMACIDQTRICTSLSEDTCTPLSGYLPLMQGGVLFEVSNESVEVPDWPLVYDMTDTQTAIALRVMVATLGIADVVFSVGDLLASDISTRAGYSSALPENQWQIEAAMWFQTALAHVQYKIVDFPNNEWFNQTANDNRSANFVKYKSDDKGYYPSLWKLCDQQLVRSTTLYQSFSMAAIIIITVVSATLLILSKTLALCVMDRKDRKAEGAPKYHKNAAYVADGKFQLLRMALKPAGYDQWADEAEEYPYRRPRGSSNSESHEQEDIRPATLENSVAIISGGVQEVEEKSSIVVSKRAEHLSGPGTW